MAKQSLAFTFLWIGLCTSASGVSQVVTNEASSPEQINPVLQWNRTLLNIVRTPGAQPPTIHSTRNFAILHIAIFEAVNNINRKFRPYAVTHPHVSQKASLEAAADQAAHDVLTALYPSFATTLDSQLQTALDQIPSDQDKNDGIEVGKAAANAILASRSKDGSDLTLPPFVPKNGAGQYQLTPPNFAPADFIQWTQVTPFALARANELRPVPPPRVNSEEYTRSFKEVKDLGFANSTDRTAEQTQIGQFWNGNIQDFWNEIAQTAALQRHLDLTQSAHLFALLNITLADAAIAFFEAKYVYTTWRPVTAIQMADVDGNRDTEPNATWLPLSTKTAPDPSYPGAHSAISAAASEVLRLYLRRDLGFDVTSESLPGITRHFNSFTEAAEEAGLSRIYAGQHFRFDHLAGAHLGHQVALRIASTILLPRLNPQFD